MYDTVTSNIERSSWFALVPPAIFLQSYFRLTRERLVIYWNMVIVSVNYM